MKDFFISYTSRDRIWAEWIAWHLEEQEFSVVIQAWGFVGNCVVKMDTAMQEAERTIAVLSPHYLEAMFTQSEWANAFRLDPTGEKDLLIPVRIAPVEPKGVLGQIVYVDLVDRNETEALELLLKRFFVVSQARNRCDQYCSDINPTLELKLGLSLPRRHYVLLWLGSTLYDLQKFRKFKSKQDR